MTDTVYLMRVQLAELVQLETLRAFPVGDTVTIIRKARLSARFTDTMQQATTSTETLAIADTTTTRKESLPQPNERRRLGFFSRWGVISFVVVVLALILFVVRLVLKMKT